MSKSDLHHDKSFKLLQLFVKAASVVRIGSFPAGRGSRSEEVFVLFVEMNKKLLLCVSSRIIPFNETSSVQGEIKASIPNSVFKLQ